MTHPLEELRESALREIREAHDEQALEAVRVGYLGKSGSISAWSEKMRGLSKEEKPVIGKLLNEARTGVTAAIEAAAAE
ncbi:MAG TPA: phenylalanine--tRNA ligase subunit alpha, partial [Chthoniobacterales bacterium]